MTNIDDIRARAEGVGATVEIDGMRDGLFIKFAPDHPDMLCINIGPLNEACYQAALDLIEAEERRQACPRCKGRGRLFEWSHEPTEDSPARYACGSLGCPHCKGTGKKVKEER